MEKPVKRYRIGEAARLSGISTANIRHYEREGLLPPGQRAGNSYRCYSDADVHALRLIRLCRSLNMSLQEVAQIIALDEASPQDCANALAVIARHLGHVRERIHELQALQQRLEQLMAVCDGRDETCHLIEALHRQAEQIPAGMAPAPSARPRHI